MVIRAGAFTVFRWILRHLWQMVPTHTTTSAQTTAPMLDACVLEDRVLYSATVLPIEWLMQGPEAQGVVPQWEVDAIMQQLQLELNDPCIQLVPLAAPPDKEVETTAIDFVSSVCSAHDQSPQQLGEQKIIRWNAALESYNFNSVPALESETSLDGEHPRGTDALSNRRFCNGLFCKSAITVVSQCN